MHSETVVVTAREATAVLFSALSLCYQDNSRTAALSLMKFHTNMYLNNI